MFGRSNKGLGGLGRGYGGVGEGVVSGCAGGSMDFSRTKNEYPGLVEAT